MKKLRVRWLVFSVDAEEIINENKQIYKEKFNKPHDNEV